MWTVQLEENQNVMKLAFEAIQRSSMEIPMICKTTRVAELWTICRSMHSRWDRHVDLETLIYAMMQKKTEIAKLQAMPAADREALIKEKEDAMTKLEADFKAFVEGLQKQYQEESTKKDKAVEEVKSSGLGLLKSVHNFENKKSKTDL
jgi:hypothetical protein